MLNSNVLVIFQRDRDFAYETPEIKLLSSLPTIRKAYGVCKSLFMRISSAYIFLWKICTRRVGSKQKTECRLFCLTTHDISFFLEIGN